jgi:hypothetical protein
VPYEIVEGLMLESQEMAGVIIAKHLVDGRGRLPRRVFLVVRASRFQDLRLLESWSRDTRGAGLSTSLLD